MNDAKSRFFASMEREMAEDDPTVNFQSERSTKSSGNNGLDIEFSVTESGRTVAHMVTDTNRSMESTNMDFSITESGRSTGDMSYNMGLTDSDRDELLKAFGPESTLSFTLENQLPTESSQAPAPSLLPPVNERVTARARCACS